MNFCRTWIFYPSHSVVYGLSFRLFRVNSCCMAAQLWQPSFNPEITLKALSYFGDGNLRSLPEDMKQRLVVAAREVDLERLPNIERVIRQSEMDYGS